MTEKMALAAPLMVPNHSPHTMQSWTTFSRYNPMKRTDSPTREQPQLRTLESLAAELSFLSTSPTAGFTYLTGDYYSSSTTTTICRARTSGSSATDGGTPRRAPMQKSRSFPKVKRDSQSTVAEERGLRKAKSFKTVRFADSQGLPLVEAHQLTVGDSSYTENEIVPYGDEEVFGPVHTVVAPRQTPASTVGCASLVTSTPVSTSKSEARPLQNSTAARPHVLTLSSPTHKRTFRFTQPGVEPGFYERVSNDKVAMESIREEARSIHGVLRVANICYDKEVTVRWSHDSWKSSHDTHAVFCANDGATDRFTFELPINGDDLVLAIRYKADGREYWDNNRGANYLISSELC